MKLNMRLKALRLRNNMTQSELGRAIGASTVTIQNWESGTVLPSASFLLSLSNLFRVSADYLLGSTNHGSESTSIMTSGEHRLLSNYRTLDTFGQKTVDTVCTLEKSRVMAAREKTVVDPNLQTQTAVRRIPKFFTPAAAGYSAPVDGDDYEMIDVSDHVPIDADFAVRIQGTSMEPYIKDGDIVYVDKDSEPTIGEVGIFSVDGAMYCKQYYIDEGRNLTLLSSNPLQKKASVYVSADSGSVVKCYGKVLLGYRIDLPDYFTQGL